MLNYVITISISAFFVPHYLSVFWEPLRENPWDIAGGALVIVLLVALNVVGIKEAAGLNILLAVLDFATQALLVLIGFVVVFSPSILVENVELGVAPTWSQFLLAIPVAMIAYTGLETISNLAEETRDPPRDVPTAFKLVGGAVFAIYLTLPAIALSALPVRFENGEYSTLLGEPPDQGGFQNDPILGVVQNLGIEGTLQDALEIYVGVLAATILFIATNAGVIGASRITYAMASYRQLPAVFRRLHPRFKTPWLAIVFFAGIVSIATLLPGETTFLGTMYSFGAMLSFTIAHAAIIALRVRRGPGEVPYKSRPEPPDPRDRVAALRDPRRARHRGRLGRDRGAGAADPLGWARLARGRLHRVRRVPPPAGAAALGDEAGTGARARPVADDRVSDHRRPGRPLARIGGGARRGRAPGRRTRRHGCRRARAGGAALPAARGGPRDHGDARRTSCSTTPSRSSRPTACGRLRAWRAVGPPAPRSCARPSCAAPS